MTHASVEARELGSTTASEELVNSRQRSVAVRLPNGSRGHRAEN